MVVCHLLRRPALALGRERSRHLELGRGRRAVRVVGSLLDTLLCHGREDSLLHVADVAFLLRRLHLDRLRRLPLRLPLRRLSLRLPLRRLSLRRRLLPTRRLLLLLTSRMGLLPVVRRIVPRVITDVLLIVHRGRRRSGLALLKNVLQPADKFVLAALRRHAHRRQQRTQFPCADRHARFQLSRPLK